MKLLFASSKPILQAFLIVGVAAAMAETGSSYNVDTDYDGEYIDGQQYTHVRRTSLFSRGLFLKDNNDDSGGGALDANPTIAPISSPTVAPTASPTAAPTSADGLQPVSGVYNTGVDSKNGNVLAKDVDDPHYTVVENSGLPAKTLKIIYFGYVPNDNDSAWIWKKSDGRPVGVTRTFETTFSLTGWDHTTAKLTGSWATDDYGLDILINGVSTGNTATGNANLQSFSITSGFQPGQNVLQFKVQGVAASAGFRVDNMALRAAKVPSIS